MGFEFFLFTSALLMHILAQCPPTCTTPEEKLYARYLKLERMNCDICQHVATLRMYASRVDHVTEVGVRYGSSMWAMLQGLHDSPKRFAGKTYRAYDIDVISFLEHDARALASQLHLDFDFQRADILKTDLADTDLLFIDTFHAYPQLRAELQKHAHHARQFIILHDTSIDGNESECLRAEKLYHYNNSCEKMSELTGFGMTEIKVGLWPAVQEFLATRHEWRLARRYTHNNGLTVLERVANGHSPSNNHCALNLVQWHDPYSCSLVPQNVFHERANIMEEMSQRLSSWTLTRLAIINLFFIAPLQHTPFSMMSETTSEDLEIVGKNYLVKALKLDTNQSIARLAFANYLCPDWRELKCKSPNQAIAEMHLRHLTNVHGTWEAYLVLGALLAGRGEVNEACEAFLKLLQLEDDNLAVVNFLGKVLRYLGETDGKRLLQLRMEELGAPTRRARNYLPLSEPYWEMVLCWRLVE